VEFEFEFEDKNVFINKTTYIGNIT
jgi:hypothetical protein